MSGDDSNNDLTSALGDVVLRAHLKQLGYGADSVGRPRIGIVNTSGGMAVCYAHLDEIAAVAAKAVEAAGGLAIEIRTSGPTDGLFFVLGGRGEVPSARELLAQDIEMMARGENLDGLLLLSSCDSTTPGQLIAVARLNLPAIVVPCGFQAGGSHCGGRVSIMDVYEGVGAVAANRLSSSVLSEMADVAIGSPGVCAGLGTANTMHMVAEALGLALPGTTPIWAGGPRLREVAAEAGRAVVALIAGGPKPHEILTEAALRNAVALVLASGGAATAIHHLQALAQERGLSTDLHALFEELGGRIRQACFVSPSGKRAMEELETAGGTLALMKWIEAELDGDALTVAGSRRAVLARVALPAEHLFSVDQAPAGDPGLLILRGNLAPEGAVVRPGTAPAGMEVFEGPAQVFDNPQAVFESLRAGTLAPGGVVVMMGSIDDTACLLTGAGLGGEVAIVSNGGFSGLSRGLVIGFMKNGTEPGHPIFRVRTGDTIRIDLAARSIDWTPAADTRASGAALTQGRASS